MITLKDLDRAYKVRTQIIECEETLASIKANAGLRSQALTGLPHSSTVSDRVGRCAVLIADMEETIKRKEAAFQVIWEEFEPFVSGIEDPVTRICFRFRFQLGFSYKEIAAEIGNYNTEEGIKQRMYRALKKQTQ